jgi:Flp pilus assembly pilin Flp
VTEDAKPRSRKVGGMLEFLQAAMTRLLMEEDGQALTEYGLILVLISIVSMVFLQILGVKVTNLLTVNF